LVAPFSMEEIEFVIKESDGNKSPGPDGFSFAFVKEFWYLMKDEVRIMFDQFLANEVVPKSLLSYFVALIPKVASPLALKDFRPISLFGTLYKKISKVLARRLAGVMNSIISQSQSAFLKGRNLVDGVVVVNEIVDFARKMKRQCLILKVDFEKAYDSVDWGFLEYMMGRVGICAKWVAWMKACVFGGSMSILVNGCPTVEIDIQRGLKQGDPLAPFLFLLVAEGFSGVTRNAVSRNLFKGFKIKNEGMGISHLQYADDTLCIGEATVDNLWTLKAVLRGFEMASGLKVHFYKSCLMGINVPTEFMNMACDFLNCSEGLLPFKYLGLPVGANPLKLATWEPLLEQLTRKLHSWGNKYVSLGGRIVLLNAVLNAIPIFYLSFLKMPVKVWRKIVKIQRDFLWGGARGGRKLCWVKWKVVCQPRSNGGLGVRDIRLVNFSLLAKWRWRLLNNEEGLWKEVLVEKYGLRVGNLLVEENGAWPRFISKWWKDIAHLEEVGGERWFNTEVVRKAGIGNSTSFWKDPWRGATPFCRKYPRLFCDCY